MVDVAAERVAGWLARFADRHGACTWTSHADEVSVLAADGARADCAVPFPPLQANQVLPYGGLVEHVLAERRVGVLLARLGGHAVGVFDGTRLVASKVGSRYVQGRTAAGGQSQKRFARRRAGQARAAHTRAADAAADVLVPEVHHLDGVVLGGDRRALAAVLDDARLAALSPLVTGRRLDVPEPRLRVLERTPEMFRAVRIRVTDPVP